MNWLKTNQWGDEITAFVKKCLAHQAMISGALSGGGVDRLLEEALAKRNGSLLEADDSTAADLATLPKDFNAALIPLVLPELLATQVARIDTMNQKTKIIKRVVRKRKDTALVGTISQAAAWSTSGGDGMPTGIGTDLFLKVTTAVDTDTTFTVTGTNELGQTISGTATVLTTDAAGTWVEVTPSDGVGTHKFLTVTTVTASGWTSAGAVDVRYDKLSQNTEGGTVAKAGIGYEDYTLTAVKYILGASLTSEAIEDARIGLAANVEGASDLVSDTLREIREIIVGEIDRRDVIAMMTAALGSSGAGNVNFSLTTPGGKTQDEHYASITNSLKQAKGLVRRRGYEANYVAMHPDNFNFLERWAKNELTYADHFGQSGYHQAGVIPSIAGLEVFQRTGVPYNRMLLGRRRLGYEYQVYVPFELKERQYQHTDDSEDVTIRQRSASVATVPESMSTLTITA